MSVYFIKAVACGFSVQETGDIYTYSLRSKKGIGGPPVCITLGSNPYKAFCGDSKS